MAMKRTFDWQGVEYQSPEYYRLYRLANLEKQRAYHRKYDSEMYRKYPVREHERRKRWQDSNKDKVKAHHKVAYALKTGELIKEACMTCNDIKTVAHHDDYSKPLGVIWLCEVHHKARHKELKLRSNKVEAEGALSLQGLEA